MSVMSHIVTVHTQVRDPAAIELACRRLQLPSPVHGEARLFATPATGWQVQLPDWKYPVVCATETGQLLYDNNHGRWGDPVQLNRFLQGYAVEKALLTARQHGYSAWERALADGSIQVSIAT
jgi:hypothetical protein